jgi:HhH-GPD superfamily base excision DNA repair protein
VGVEVEQPYYDTERDDPDGPATSSSIIQHLRKKDDLSSSSSCRNTTNNGKYDGNDDKNESCDNFFARFAFRGRRPITTDAPDPAMTLSITRINTDPTTADTTSTCRMGPDGSATGECDSLDVKKGTRRQTQHQPTMEPRRDEIIVMPAIDPPSHQSGTLSNPTCIARTKNSTVAVRGSRKQGNKKISSKNDGKDTTDVRLKDLPIDRQQEILKKWHSFLHDGLTTTKVASSSSHGTSLTNTAAGTPVHLVDVGDDDENADKDENKNENENESETQYQYTVDDRRYQLFVAVRIHAQCQDVAVHKAMSRLYENIVPFTIRTVAAMTIETLASLLSNLQYHTTKAKHVIQASKDIIDRYNGIVPCTYDGLKQLIGIGPIFADLLSYLNTYEMHANKLDTRNKR